MKIFRNNIIPFRGFKAINLFGVLFVRTEASLDDADLNHEKIHTAQMKELFYLGFYILYLLEWLKGILSGKDSLKAYHEISFEKEAYSNQDKTGYLASREPFAQWKGKSTPS